jgi:hypothetical protein
MTDTDNEIRERVDELLRKFGVENPPVPVDQVAKSSAFCSVPYLQMRRFPGRSFARMDMLLLPLILATILTASASPSHMSSAIFSFILASRSMLTKISESTGDEWQIRLLELIGRKSLRTASRAELLMPTRFMKSDLDTIRTVDKRAVTLFALRYKVSPEAMKIRLSNLGIVGPF